MGWFVWGFMPMVWDEGAGHVHIVDGVLLVSSSAQNAPSEPPRRPPSLSPSLVAPWRLGGRVYAHSARFAARVAGSSCASRTGTKSCRASPSILTPRAIIGCLGRRPL